MPISFQNSAVGNFSPKTKGTKTKAARCLFFLMYFPFLYILNFEFFVVITYCLHFAKFVCLLKRLQRMKQEWQKSPAGTRQTLGLVWRNRKKISQIIKDYFYLPFFLLIILCYVCLQPGGTVRQLYKKLSE